MGTEFFEGLDAQYWTMYKTGLISKSPTELYTIIDDVDEVLEKIN